MKQADAGLVVGKPLTPEQLAALKEALKEYCNNPQRYSAVPVIGNCEPKIMSLVPRKQKALWFIAGTGVGLALALTALVIVIFGVVV